MEAVVEQRRPEVDSDVEDAAESNGLQPRSKSRHQFSGTAHSNGVTKGDNNGGEESSENTAYLHENGGALEGLDFHKIANSGAFDANGGYEITETTTDASSEEVGENSRSAPEQEIVGEEVVELEFFHKAIDKLHDHMTHCPNCKAPITRVVLRRKIVKEITPTPMPTPTPTPQPQPQPPTEKPEPGKPFSLLGCLSCFGLFTSEGDPFPIFPDKEGMNAVPRPDRNDKEINSGDNGCLSIFHIFKDEPKVPTIKDMTKPDPVQSPSPSPTPDTIHVASKPLSGHDEPPLDVTQEKHESSIIIPPDAVDAAAAALETGAQTQGQDSTSFEILKSIVYGGLMEVITSLSIVASAVAADATALTIISLALANLIGGIFIIGHNIWDLKDDYYKFSSQQTNQLTRNKYKELLGQVQHFPIHVFFAILSFIVFGIVPPVVYGYAFHETNDNDFTVMVVAIASLVCVGLLAVFKAYVDRCTGFLDYVKTVAYYLTTAIVVSGVSYVVGNLITRLIEELGLFETTSGVAMSLLPEAKPSLAYY
ncbi:hypothetical protein OSB04_023115 [Centaurea solstitialis]|uniref:Membrane protein of ER body-like protein n=1 Tax=Centaurea solstitialis TaxID=347529 RepID=A0AA38SR17_9ASTR|nr:hypothetical protein OSB04_023115 [Centaurea solstitialis]